MPNRLFNVFLNSAWWLTFEVNMDAFLLSWNSWAGWMSLPSTRTAEGMCGEAEASFASSLSLKVLQSGTDKAYGATACKQLSFRIFLLLTDCTVVAFLAPCGLMRNKTCTVAMLQILSFVVVAEQLCERMEVFFVDVAKRVMSNYNLSNSRDNFLLLTVFGVWWVSLHGAPILMRHEWVVC